MGKNRLLDAGRRLTLLTLAGMLTACAELPPVAVVKDTLTPQQHETLGDSYLAQGEKIHAVEQYEAALHRDRKFVPALIALGNIAFEDHAYGQARSYFRRALKIAPPDDPGISNNLAMVYLAEGKHLDRAQKLVEKSLPHAGPLIPYLLDTYANIELRQGRYTEARRALDRAAAAYPPNDPDFQRHLLESRQKLTDAMRLNGSSSSDGPPL